MSSVDAFLGDCFLDSFVSTDGFFSDFFDIGCFSNTVSFLLSAVVLSSVVCCEVLGLLTSVSRGLNISGSVICFFPALSSSLLMPLFFSDLFNKFLFRLVDGRPGVCDGVVDDFGDVRSFLECSFCIIFLNRLGFCLGLSHFVLVFDELSSDKSSSTG